MSRAAARARPLALALLSITSTLVVAEVALRIARPRSEMLRILLHSHGDEVRYDDCSTLEALRRATPQATPRPYAVFGGFRLNSRGFRTPEYAEAKGAGTYRIVAIGDSYTFSSGGVPLPQMWHALVGAGLEAARGGPVEVVNLGIPGTGTPFYRRLYELEGRRLGPDLVLVGFSVGTDIDEHHRPPVPAVERWSYAWRLVRGLKQLSRTLQVAEEARRRESAPPAAGEVGGQPVAGYVYDPERPLLSEDAFLRVERRRLPTFAAANREATRRLLVESLEPVLAMQRLAAASGAKLCVALIPDPLQVEPGLQAKLVPAGEASAYDFEGPDREAVALLQAEGIVAVDALPPLQAAAASAPCYRKQDTHLNAVGNRILADAILAALAPS